MEYYLLSPFYKEKLEHKLKVAIERKRWLKNLYRGNKDLEAIIELIYLVSSTLNPKEVLYLVVKKISEMINVIRCSMISIDVEDQRYAYVVSTSEDPTNTNIRLDLQKYPEIRKVLLFKKPVVRGIQFILGIFLVRAGYELLVKKSIFIKYNKHGANDNTNA